MDFLITNAKLLDHHKKKETIGGVAVVDSRIIEVGEGASSLPVDRFDRVIDAKGCFLIPGFFDIHSKGDLSAIAEPSRTSALSQGINVEVIGQDGFSVAPVSSKNYLLHSEYVVSELGNPQLKWKWESVFQYLDQLHLKTSTNVMFYAPHGTMRLECSLNPVISSAGLSALQYILERAMDDGAIGMSVSVSQSPSSVGWDDEREMATLLKVLRQKNGVLCVNIQGSRNHIKEIDRAITAARNYDLKLHISRIMPSSSEHLETMLSVLDKRRKEAVDLMVDLSPYPSRLLKLLDLLPPSMRAYSPEEIRVKFKKQESMNSLLHSMNYTEEDLENFKLVTTSKRDMKKYEGASMGTIALERDESIHELLLNFLTSDPEKTFFEHEVVRPEILRKAFELQFVLPATTGHMNGRCLPDTFSALPAYFSAFSRAGIHELSMKLSEVPASFYGLKWGLRQGNKANLVLLDAENFHSEGSYADPRVTAEGIDLAAVNGRIAWEKGKPTGSRTGEVLSWG